MMHQTQRFQSSSLILGAFGQNNWRNVFQTVLTAVKNARMRDFTINGSISGAYHPQPEGARRHGFH